MLKSAVVAAAGIVVAPLVASTEARAATGKATKAAMQYQDHPKGKAECSTCMQFVPGASAKANGTCKVVDGAISPKGWCIAYAPKS